MEYENLVSDMLVITIGSILTFLVGGSNAFLFEETW